MSGKPTKSTFPDSRDAEFPKTCLYEGAVFHKRFRPNTHALRYRVVSMLSDIDRLEDLDRLSWCLSVNRFNLFSLRESDFGDGTGELLRVSVERQLQCANITTPAERIMLLAYPRILGYAFNPLSVFYCYDAAAKLFAVLYEVHNTFGEKHTYVLRAHADAHQRHAVERTGLPTYYDQSCDKRLHVSPFAPMQMRYSFRVSRPSRELALAIHVRDSDGLMLTAVFSGQKVELCGNRLLVIFLKYPLMTLKVIAGIHWEALLLWKKGVPWFSHSRTVG